jgi:hypothetical protein
MSDQNLDIENKQKFYLDIVENWVNDGPEVIAKRWNVKPMTISFAAGRLRRMGINLPKRNADALFTPDFLQQLREAASKYPAQEPRQKQFSQQASLSKACVVCGKAFYKSSVLSRANWEKRTTCSRRCAFAAKRGEVLPPSEQDEFDIVYEQCQFSACPKLERRYVLGTGVTYKGLHFCSEQCKENYLEGGVLEN